MTNKNEEFLPFYKATAQLIYWIRGKPYWKRDRNSNAKKDQLAGTIGSSGYRKIQCKIDGHGKGLSAHRLAWFMEFHKLPEHDLDHIDQDKDNNRIENLREVSPSQNLFNTSKRLGTSSKYKGVIWHKATGKWMARITVMQKVHHLGLFDIEEQAAKAYDNAVRNSVYMNYAVLNFPDESQDEGY